MRGPGVRQMILPDKKRDRRLYVRRRRILGGIRTRLLCRKQMRKRGEKRRNMLDRRQKIMLSERRRWRRLPNARRRKLLGT